MIYESSDFYKTSKVLCNQKDKKWFFIAFLAVSRERDISIETAKELTMETNFSLNDSAFNVIRNHCLSFLRFIFTFECNFAEFFKETSRKIDKFIQTWIIVFAFAFLKLLMQLISGSCIALLVLIGFTALVSVECTTPTNWGISNFLCEPRSHSFYVFRNFFSVKAYCIGESLVDVDALLLSLQVITVHLQAKSPQTFFRACMSSDSAIMSYRG